MNIQYLDLSFNENGKIFDENSFPNSCLPHDDNRNMSHHSKIDYSHLDNVVFSEYNITEILHNLGFNFFLLRFILYAQIYHYFEQFLLGVSIII